MPFLEISGVSKSYGGSTILRDINLSVAQGEFLAIVGYSGAGKTTLMSMLAGLVAPDAGTMTLEGQAITGPSLDRTLIFQNYSLLPWLTVFDNVMLGVEARFPKWSLHEKVALAHRQIAMVNLTPAKDKLPAQLSGGMRQRVSVARSLAMDPKILLMDEPFSALDALTRATLQDEIDRICQQAGKTVVLITNDVDEGILLADRIIPLSAGPGATLGPEIKITLPRPRDRTTINHDPEFKRIRKEVFDWLTGPGKAAKSAGPAVARTALPNIKAVHPVA